MIETDGWEVRTVGFLGSVRGGKRLPKGRSLTVSPTQHPYIRVTDMRKGRVDSSDLRFVPEDVAPSIRAYRIFRDDIFISVAGTLGIVGRIPEELNGANLTENADRITSIACDVDYLMYSLLGEAIQNEIDSIRTVGAQPKLALGRIKQFKIPIPKTRTEQARISQALRNADDLIATLELVIAKRQAIKQGMMQQLLTGQTRLPGFAEEWPIVSLGEAGVVTGGGVDKSSNHSEPAVLLLNYMDVYRSEFIDHQSTRHVVTAPSSKIAKCSIKKGDVFFTPTSETPEDVARSAVADEDLSEVVYSYHLVRWRPAPGWDHSYLAFAFSTEEFRSQASTLAAGSGTRYVVSMPGFRSLVVPRPSLDEQRAIGVVLRDVSSEINTLSNRLEKTRDIKTGMMQQLLTGRTRLPVEVES